MQRIDPNQATPSRIMLVLDDKRYEFIMEKAAACMMSTTQFLRDIVESDSKKARRLVEKQRPGIKEHRINLVLTDILSKSIQRKSMANKTTKAGYMRALIDNLMDD